MSDDVWKDLKYFSRDENWGNPYRMDPDFLRLLDAWRGHIKKAFSLTSPAFATQGHSPGSMHYIGRAADGRLYDPKTLQPLSLKDHILFALESPFGGVGIYTWSKQGPFLHLDNREMKNHRAIWISESQGDYQPLSSSFLRRTFSLVL